MARTPPGRTRERVYRFMRERLLAGDSPSLREVQQAMGFAAVESARRQLERLVAEGRLEKASGRARGYRLPPGEEGDDAVPVRQVPLIGQVAAGPLEAAIEVPEGYVAFSMSGAAGEHFALRVQGESMIDAGILPGDVVIVRRQSEAPSGAIVVARVGEEATVKRLRRRGRRVELLAENPRVADIVPDPEALEILGVVVELRRQL
ncbi:MAG: transcriptional repressor LexA [Deltaproteobacteria bacterium]|nr:transcriptional repressor LexA [Deltaproteobacteria bacterium]